MPPRRQVWTDNEKQTLLEGLIVMQSQGFDPNDTNAWFEPSNSAAIITFLRNGHVREHWLDNVDKARRKYMNTKAAYNSFRLLDQRHTGGGVRTPFPLEDLVEQLANADNPIARPPIVIDNGTIIRDATHPANVESA